MARKFLPRYPMTVAAMGIDNADPKTGMEYVNTNIGDGGFILKLGDGTVTDATWKARKFSWGPVDGDTKNPRVENIPIPESWFAKDFDDSSWSHAKEYSEEAVGPKEPFFEHDFIGAKFIWSDDVLLDNIVIFGKTVKSPPDGKQRPDFPRLTNVVPRIAGGGASRGGQRLGMASHSCEFKDGQNEFKQAHRLHTRTGHRQLQIRSISSRHFAPPRWPPLAGRPRRPLARAVARNAKEDPAVEHRSVGSIGCSAGAAR